MDSVRKYQWQKKQLSIENILTPHFFVHILKHIVSWLDLTPTSSQATVQVTIGLRYTCQKDFCSLTILLITIIKQILYVNLYSGKIRHITFIYFLLFRVSLSKFLLGYPDYIWVVSSLNLPPRYNLVSILVHFLFGKLL